MSHEHEGLGVVRRFSFVGNNTSILTEILSMYAGGNLADMAILAGILGGYVPGGAIWTLLG